MDNKGRVARRLLDIRRANRIALDPGDASLPLPGRDHIRIAMQRLYLPPASLQAPGDLTSDAAGCTEDQSNSLLCHAPKKRG
jgi:hypothetical protein